MMDALSYKIIGEAMRVHREIGPGVDELFYHELLSEYLTELGIVHLWRPRQTLIHRGRVADIFEPDIVIMEHYVLELKMLKKGRFSPEHYIQLKCYLKFWNIGVGPVI